MKLFLAILLVVAVSAYTTEETRFLWNEFVQSYNKVYAPEDYYYRYKIFSHNIEKIAAHNKLGKSYTLGVNEFADLSWEEFREQKLGHRLYAEHTNDVHLSTEDLPETVDWIKAGAVMPVKNQGQCGSCWAFSAVAALEAFTFLKGKKLVGLSEQELVDCSRSYGNEGCNGGWMNSSFQYAIDKKGLASDKDYKYTAKDGKCQVPPKKHVPASDPKSFANVEENNCLELKAAVAKGVVSVAIEADQWQFQFYSGGVFDDESCGTNLDHGVSVVGYDNDESSGKDYWNVRNSWGNTWGLKGYIWIARSEEEGPGICGICMAASWPQ